MKYTSQKGFSLIELMVVVVIIGILAGIAIPRYQDHVVKTQITEAVAEISAVKNNIEVCLLETKKIPKELTNQTDLELGVCNAGATNSQLISELNASFNDNAGELIGTLGNNANPVLKEYKITWNRDRQGNWACTTTLTKDNKLREFVPVVCVGNNVQAANNGNGRN